MTVHAFHILHDGRKWWVLHDLTRRYRGPVNGTRRRAVACWTREYGKIDKLVTYRGFMRLSEAAMTIASLMSECS